MKKVTVKKKRKNTVNRKHKDTVFRMLFREKGNLLELYNAVNKTNYTDENDIEITTLENAIYMTNKNDLACVVDMRMGMFEHQSTVNPNLPLRNLDYIADSFVKYSYDKDIYGSTSIVLPNPKFVVFYNGLEKQPLLREYRLSELYAHAEETPNLELIVLQYNINIEENAEILQTCRLLREYSEFIGAIRRYQKKYSIERAVDSAINECISKGILEDFLKKNRAEVRAMSIYEFDVELHERTLKEESYADGYNKGEKSGFIKGEESGFIKGEESGFIKGEESGFIKGEESGFIKGEESGFIKGEESGFIKGEESGFIKGEESGFIKGEESGFIKGEESGERKGLIKAYYECGRTITDISRNMGCPEDEVINVLKEMRII